MEDWPFLERHGQQAYRQIDPSLLVQLQKIFLNFFEAKTPI